MQDQAKAALGQFLKRGASEWTPAGNVIGAAPSWMDNSSNTLLYTVANNVSPAISYTAANIK